MMNVLALHYQLEESTAIFRDIRSDFDFFFPFFGEILLSKQNSPRWDTAFYDVTSEAILFAYVP